MTRETSIVRCDYMLGGVRTTVEVGGQHPRVPSKRIAAIVQGVPRWTIEYSDRTRAFIASGDVRMVVHGGLT